MRMSKFLLVPIFVCSLLFLVPTGKSQAQVKSASPQFEKDLRDARMSFHRTYYEKASVLFDSLILLKEDFALAHAYMAMIDFMLYKDPTYHIERALTLTQDSDPNNHITLALCNFANGDYWTCESNIQEFLKKEPQDEFGAHLLAITLIGMDRAEEGRSALSELLKKHSGYFPAYNHMGYAFLKLNKHEEALQAFKTFLKKDSLNPSAYDSYAQALFEKGEADKAIANLSKAVLIDPEFAYGWNHMGDIFYQMGETYLAKKAFERGKLAAKYYGPEFIYSLDQKLADLNE